MRLLPPMETEVQEQPVPYTGHENLCVAGRFLDSIGYPVNVGSVLEECAFPRELTCEESGFLCDFAKREFRAMTGTLPNWKHELVDGECRCLVIVGFEYREDLKAVVEEFLDLFCCGSDSEEDKMLSVGKEMMRLGVAQVTRKKVERLAGCLRVVPEDPRLCPASDRAELHGLVRRMFLRDLAKN